MNKILPIASAVGIGIVIVFLGINSLNFESAPPVTQHDLRIMIDEWMDSPDRNDLEPRLEIMKTYYTFEESGQKLSDDQEGRVMLNQIRKMVSFDIPKTELDQIKAEIRNDLRELGFNPEE